MRLTGHSCLRLQTVPASKTIDTMSGFLYFDNVSFFSKPGATVPFEEKSAWITKIVACRPGFRPW